MAHAAASARPHGTAHEVAEIAAQQPRAGVGALVVVDLVAVVATLAGSDRPVAADVGAAVGLAGVHVAVHCPVVAALARPLVAVASRAPEAQLGRQRDIGLDGPRGK